MNTEIVEVNKRVQVLVRYSSSGDVSCYPLKMRYNNQEYVFSELGLRHPTVKGKRMVHVFDMTDGIADYRLEFDAESLSWLLVYITDRSYAVNT